uniref:Glycerol-3-phosphate acyltransferase 1, mitochondrial n=1 Tax=Leptobrachium leishanense TaxID=445787 RepID=A0A8C5WKV6_9ANUR
MDEASYSLGIGDVSYLPNLGDYTGGRVKNCSEEWGERISSPVAFRSATLNWKETLVGRKRPFVGRCCYVCSPVSREKFYNSSIPSLGLRNVIYINETHTRHRGWLARRLCYILFVQERDVNRSMFCSNMSETVLNQSRVQKAIEDVAAEMSPAGKPDPKSVGKVKRKAKKILQEMVASISPTMIRLTGWVLLQLFNSFFWNIQVHKGQLEIVKKASSEMNVPLVFLPVHKSHIDYLLLTFILFCHNIKAPHIASGNNLNIPIFSTLIHLLGGFFIRRKLDETRDGKKDVLYRSLLQGGKPKKDESLWSIARGVFRMLRKNYGCVRVDFAQPFSLKEYLENQRQKPPVGQHRLEQTLLPAILSTRANDAVNGNEAAPHPDPRNVADDPSRRQMITDLANHVLYTAEKCCAVMSTHIVACLLLYRYRKGVTLSVLVEDFFSMKEEVLSRDFDLGFSGSSEDVVMHAIHLLANSVNISHDIHGNEFFISPNTDIPAVFELNFYSNGVLHVYVTEAIVACVMHVELRSSHRDGSPEASSGTISQERLLRTAANLCHLLSNEAILALPCQMYYQVCHEAVQRLITYGIILVAEEDQEDGSPNLVEQPWENKLPNHLPWRSEEEDEDSDFGEEQRDRYLKVSSLPDHQQFTLFLRKLLGPILEAYSSAAAFLHGFEGPVSEREYTQSLHRYLIARTEKSVALYAESATLCLAKNAVTTFLELGVFQVRKENRDCVLDLSSTFLPQGNRHKLLEYIMGFMEL